MSRKEAQATFDGLCQQAADILTRAARFARQSDLSDIDIAKADAAAGLAGAIFHKISIHGADADDYRALENDLHHIARKLSPLIEAIGAEAAQNTAWAFDLSPFLEVCEVGMESALAELHCARGRAADDTSADDRADHDYKLAREAV